MSGGFPLSVVALLINTANMSNGLCRARIMRKTRSDRYQNSPKRKKGAKAIKEGKTGAKTGHNP